MKNSTQFYLSLIILFFFGIGYFAGSVTPDTWTTPLFSPVSTPTPQPVILPPSSPVRTPTPVDPGREQYYRGIYDVCVYFGTREHPRQRRDVERACRVVIDKALKKKWYETPSPDWKWPVPGTGANGA